MTDCCFNLPKGKSTEWDRKNALGEPYNHAGIGVVRPAAPAQKAEDVARAEGKIDVHGHASGLGVAPRVS